MADRIRGPERRGDFGEPGDRYLNNHGTRVRNLTEVEDQYVEEARWRRATAFFVMFSSIALGMALHSWKMGWTPQASGEQLIGQQPMGRAV